MQRKTIVLTPLFLSLIASAAMLAQVDQHTNVLAFEGTVIDTLQHIVDGPHHLELMHEAVAAQPVGTAQAPWATW